MSIRAFQLPQDIDVMNSLIMDGFQYPENPEWSIQEDEKQGMIDRINGAKRIWPVIGVLRTFVPLFRDVMCGFIHEQDGQPAGLINYLRQSNAPEWWIVNVTVLPAFRRRGIARRLVETTIEELRRRNARVAFLEVVVGNAPAFNLYQELGFDPFTESREYHFQKDEAITPISLPAGYELKSLHPFDWRTRFRLAQRITPANITKYEPITETRYRIPVMMALFGKLFESAGGAHSERFAIYSNNGGVVGFGQFTYRKRAGGVNFTRLSIDPAHAHLAEFMLRHVFSEIQRVSPGRRIELSFEDWQSALVECAAALGCEKRFGYHRMALKF